MMPTDDLLTQIRDGMRDLVGLETSTPEDVLMGLLLAIMAVADCVDGQTALLLCEIHGDAQAAWDKARHKEKNNAD